MNDERKVRWLRLKGLTLRSIQIRTGLTIKTIKLILYGQQNGTGV